MRVLMMGTGTFALPTFRALIASRHDVVGLVTQPDRVGRGHHRHPHPMKELAVDKGVEVFQPDRVNTEESLDRLRAFGADVFVVAAYGQILSAELLAIPPQGAINLHGSLLPKYRGAAPIQYAVLNGESETGITVFRIEPKLDAGPILGVIKTPIQPTETSGELHDRLAELGPEVTLEVLDGMEQGTLEPRVQGEAPGTRAPKIPKSMGRIDWTMSSQQLDCHVRAMQPWPMAETHLVDEGRDPVRLLVLEVRDADEDSDRFASSCDCGAIQVVDGDRLFAKTGTGAVEVLRVQPAGKRPMDVASFLRGRSVTSASRFATP